MASKTHNRVPTPLVLLALLLALFMSGKSDSFAYGHSHGDHDEDHVCGAVANPEQKAAMSIAMQQYGDRNRALQQQSSSSSMMTTNNTTTATTTSSKAPPEYNYTVPVFFTVFQAEDGRGNISDDALRIDFMESLNHGFRDTVLDFVAVGIQRVYNDSYFKCDEDLELEFKSNHRQGDGMETLNVYLCNLFAMGRFGIYGVADFPTATDSDYDGVILMNPALDKGSLTYMLMENIFVHEVGHWLGLYHTFEGGCDPEGGDEVSDTPAHATKTSSIIGGGATCWMNLTEGHPDTCPDNTTGVDPGLDPISNYMNYFIGSGGSGDIGYCSETFGRFTAGQIERMMAMFEAFRGRRITPQQLPTSTMAPSSKPSPLPSRAPFATPSSSPVSAPSLMPTLKPIASPTVRPSLASIQVDVSQRPSESTSITIPTVTLPATPLTTKKPVQPPTARPSMSSVTKTSGPIDKPSVAPTRTLSTTTPTIATTAVAATETTATPAADVAPTPDTSMIPSASTSAASVHLGSLRAFVAAAASLLILVL